MKLKNKSKIIAPTIIMLFLFFSLSSTAFGWGKDGHRIIARLASKLLTQKAQTQVNSLLAQGETLESVAVWADGLRGNFDNPGARPETPLWHFVDIPRGKTYEASRDCAETPNGSCVISALVIFQEILSKTKKGYYNERFNRYEALKFIVHFTGDIHQPLHCIDDKDAGGNGKKVWWLDGSTERSLHHVWDDDILSENMKKANKDDEDDYADYLFQSFTPAEKNMALPPPATKPTMVSRAVVGTWARDAHVIAENAYNLLGQPDATNHYTLGSAYYNKTSVSVNAQLKLGAIRLARILNENLR